MNTTGFLNSLTILKTSCLDEVSESMGNWRPEKSRYYD